MKTDIKILNAMKLPALTPRLFLMPLGPLASTERARLREAMKAARKAGISIRFCGTKVKRTNNTPLKSYISMSRAAEKPKAAPLYRRTKRVAGKPMIVSPAKVIIRSNARLVAAESKNT